LNSPANSAEPGQFITLYGTGFGILFPGQAADGVPAPAQPLRTFVQSIGVSAASVSFNGLAPGLVGVDQVNAQILNSAPEGCAVPFGVTTSQPVTISIHRGGGACVDPPAAADGNILLQRVTTVGTANDGTVETLDATFTQSPGRIATPYKLYQANNGATIFRGLVNQAPTCSIPGYLELSAGALSLKTPSSTIGGITAAPGSSYHVTLPPGTLQAGAFTLAPDVPGTVGPFQANIAFGQDIQILSPPPAVGSTINLSEFKTLSWTGGDPNSIVNVSLISHYPQNYFRNSCQALASAGQCTLGGST
ncbi:MAG: hypothetical protein M3Z09_07010, partial [Acidobacteriota bacterium]|nr:hypothetical protein [Acidobacteriota bacterium]